MRQISNRLTRLGTHFLFLGSFAVFGGSVRGFNLLLVLAAILIGALLMQWRWTRRSIASVTVTRRLPNEAFAGDPFSVRFRLTNHRRFLTTWMIRIEDQIERVRAPTNDQHRTQDSATSLCGVAAIRAGQTESADYDCVITQRGRYRFGSIRVETTFPLNLFRCRKVIETSSEICVLPKLLNLRHHWTSSLFGRLGGAATTARQTGSSEGDFFGLRDWQQGDSTKWIHWRTTARLNKLAVRQLEQQQHFDLCIVVDPFALSEADHERAELAISLAATLVAKMDVSQSNRIVLAVAGRSLEVVVGGGSGAARRRMLDLLVDAEISDRPALEDVVGQSIRLAGSATDLVIVSSRSRADAMMTGDRAMSPNPSVAPQRNVPQWNVRWIDVRDDVLVDSTAKEST